MNPPSICGFHYKRNIFKRRMCGFLGIEKGFDRYSQSLVSTYCNATDVISSKYCLIHPWGFIPALFSISLVLSNDCWCGIFIFL